MCLTGSGQMRRIDYYLVRTVGATMALALVALVGILTIFTFLEQIEDMENNYDLLAVMMYCLYSIPRVFYEIIPYAALIGCLAGLGLLASSSELVVMRSVGVSTWSISMSAMKPALVLVVMGLLLGEYILPDVERQARNDRIEARSDDADIAPFYGFWYREGDVFMHFDEVSQSGLLGGISHYEFDQNDRLKRTLFADRAVFHDVRENERYWLMEGVTITEFGGDRIETRELTSIEWRTRLEPDLLSTEILVQPDRMSLRELRAKITYMKAQGLNSQRFELGFWQKLLQPLATIALVLVAISFVFGPLRESTMGMRVVAGLIVGILFKFVQDLLSPASLVYGFPPVVAVLIPIALCLVAGYVLLRRAG